MGALLEEYEQEAARTRLHRGDFVEGSVVMVDREEVLVDIGGKMEAVIPRGEIPLEDDEIPLKRGDQIGAVVIAGENSDGRPVLSIIRARAEVGWRDLQARFDSGEIIEGEVVDHNKGGLIVQVEEVRGFVPLSQIVELRRGGTEEQVEEKLRSMRGQQLFLKIIEMNRRRNRLILSERAAAQERRAQLKDQLLETLQPGEIRKGRVSSLTDFGAFVDLGGADGLVHLSELSWGQVQHPSQVLKVGQEIDVRVVGVDRDTKKIALSLKQVEENPWTRIEQRYGIGDTVEATITKLAQFGAFAELEPGVEGLVHISELSEERITHPKQVVREGERVNLKVIKIDSQRHRIGLSLRQAEDAGGDFGDLDFGDLDEWGGGSQGGDASSESAEQTSESAEQTSPEETPSEAPAAPTTSESDEQTSPAEAATEEPTAASATGSGELVSAEDAPSGEPATPAIPESGEQPSLKDAGSEEPPTAEEENQSGGARASSVDEASSPGAAALKSAPDAAKARE